MARSNLLPVLAGHEGISLVALIDLDETRAKELAVACGIKRTLTSLDALSPDDVDAVVLATPPAHHADASIALANRGIHVFVEKPMAVRAADAEAMVAAAEASCVTLGVGLYRRMLPSVRLMANMIGAEEYGRPLSIDIEEGGLYSWSLATLDVLTPGKGGGGVLIDIGSHVIDLALHFVRGDAHVLAYRDNSRGGIETDCVAELEIRSRAGRIPCRVELSRTRQLRGSIRVVCERATIELLRGNFTSIVVRRPPTEDGGQPEALSVTGQSTTSGYLGYDAFRAQFDTWLAAIATGEESAVSGRSVVPVVRVIEQCYAQRTELREPWTDEGLRERMGIATVPDGDRRQRVLVTGAGGFLGGRTVELLRGKFGYEVVALIKEPRGAARLARWPTEIVLGDVCSGPDVAQAIRGCDAVVHCAVGTSWDPAESRRVTVDGTRTVATAALRAGIRRFVHISTMFVHRRGAGTCLDEATALEPAKTDGYGRAKLDAERALNTVARRGLSTIVLRPTRIYGPLSKTFTVRPLEAMRAGSFGLRGDPAVPANMVYVDNVVEAIAAALSAPDDLGGRAFLVSDPEQVTLREFYEFFARWSGAEVQIVPLDAAEARPSGAVRRWIGGARAIATSAEVRALVHRVLDTDPVGRLPKLLWNASPRLQRELLRRFGVDAAVIYRPAGRETNLLAYRGEPERVRVDRAVSDLGYHPSVTHERAMQLTLAWAESARLVPRVEGWDRT